MEKRRLVDFENHYMPESLIELMAGRKSAPRYDRDEGLFYINEGAGHGSPMMPGLFAEEERVRDMDRAGIDTAVISGSPLAEQRDLAFAAEAARLSNDALFALEKCYPGRFRSFAILPVYDAEASVRELRRCKNELGFAGWLTFSNSGGIWADGDEMLPVFEEAERLGMCVYIHPAHPDYARLYGCGDGLSSAGLGFAVDAAVGIMRMVTRGLFDRLPELKVIIGHLGEGLPFMMKRMDDHIGGRGDPNAGENLHEPSWYFKRNIWVTTGGNDSPEAFQCAKSVLGAERILFSTDYPFEAPQKTVRAFESFAMTPQERDAVSFGNAERFFGV